MAPVKRRFPAKSTLRRAAASVVAVSALTLTSGCAMFNPVQTNQEYVPADGVPADIGKVALRDLVLVSDGEGTAVLAGSAINTGTEDVTVQLSPQGEGGAPAGGSELELGPREQVNLATEGLQFSDVTAKPGRLVPVAVRSSDGGTTVVQVPVLAATGAYATVTPAG
jgi:hypothetical protein